MRVSAEPPKPVVTLEGSGGARGAGGEPVDALHCLAVLQRVIAHLVQTRLEELDGRVDAVGHGLVLRDGRGGEVTSDGNDLRGQR